MPRNDTPLAQPVFIGSTLADHTLFVVALFRYQHHSLPLALLHPVTFALVHVALHAIAFSLFGSAGPVALCIALAAWAVRVDAGPGVLFGLLELSFAYAAISLVPAGTTVALALASMVCAIAVTEASHLVLQGYLPRPPACMASMRASHKAAFVPYFVLMFGLFFMLLELAMRLLNYREGLNRRASAVASEWHETAVGRAAADSRETQLHQRAVAELV